MINPPKADYGYAVFLPENSDEAWLVKAYTVRFNVNGHGEAPDDQHLAAGGKVEKPEDPTASGYAFGGWFKESACQNEWNYDTDTVPDNGNTVLYAKWISNAVPAAVSDNNQAETSAQADQAKRITIQKTPAKVKAKAKKHIVTVSWKKIKKNKKTKAIRAIINGIVVQYSTDPAFPKETTVSRIIGKNKVKLVLKGLQRKMVYYVRVRYVGTDGVSNWKTKRVRTK